MVGLNLGKHPWVSPQAQEGVGKWCSEARAPTVLSLITWYSLSFAFHRSLRNHFTDF